jgi:hypothetical protein
MAGEDVLMVMQKDGSTVLPRARVAEAHLCVANVLAPGRYVIACGVIGHGTDVWDWIDDGPSIEVESSFGGAEAYDSRLGLVTVQADWRVRSLDAAREAG